MKYFKKRPQYIKMEASQMPQITIEDRIQSKISDSQEMHKDKVGQLFAPLSRKEVKILEQIINQNKSHV